MTEVVFFRGVRFNCDPSTAKFSRDRLVRWMRAEARRRTREGDYQVFVSFELYYTMPNSKKETERRCEVLWHRLEATLWHLDVLSGVICTGQLETTLQKVRRRSIYHARFTAYFLFSGPREYDERGLDLPLDRSVQRDSAFALSRFRKVGETITRLPGSPIHFDYPSEEDLAAWHEVHGTAWL